MDRMNIHKLQTARRALEIRDHRLEFNLHTSNQQRIRDAYLSCRIRIALPTAGTVVRGQGANLSQSPL